MSGIIEQVITQYYNNHTRSKQTSSPTFLLTEELNVARIFLLLEQGQAQKRKLLK